MLRKLREAGDRLTDAELHELLADAAPGNGGGEPGRDRRRGLRRACAALLAELQGLGIVVRDVDRGLIDFPSIRDEREVYLCWELGEDEIALLARARHGLWRPPAARLNRGRRPLSPAERVVARRRDRGRASMLLPWYGIPFGDGLSVTGLDAFGFAAAALLVTVARGRRC